MVIMHDVTDVNKAAQLRADFVANVSHELRTPLTAMMGFIETLQGPARGDIFVGSGQTAGAIAGEIRHKADFTILVPTLRLGPASVATD